MLRSLLEPKVRSNQIKSPQGLEQLEARSLILEVDPAVVGQAVLLEALDRALLAICKETHTLLLPYRVVYDLLESGIRPLPVAS